MTQKELAIRLAALSAELADVGAGIRTQQLFSRPHRHHAGLFFP
jgi:hypothetical protein